MTPNQMRKLLPVAQAWSEGRTVQWASYGADDWRDYYNEPCETHQPCIFLNPRFRWRVKPDEPMWGPWTCKVCGHHFPMEQLIYCPRCHPGHPLCCQCGVCYPRPAWWLVIDTQTAGVINGWPDRGGPPPAGLAGTLRAVHVVEVKP